MTKEVKVLRQELQELREENAALLEALHLAQRGVVDLRGHLSKWNPDATAQGIFTQDWELRYFVLSGTLLKYYSSERDVGIEHPRGVLELQDCYVEVELPVKSSGPFIFQIRDPNQELLLRLSADHLKIARSWVRTLAAAGLLIQGFERLSTQYYQVHRSGSNLALSNEGLKTAEVQDESHHHHSAVSDADSGHQGLGVTRAWSSVFGRMLSQIGGVGGNLGSAPPPPPPAAAAVNDNAGVSLTAPAVQRMHTAPPTHPGAAAAAARSAFQQHYFQQQQQQLLESEDSGEELQSLQHLKRLSTISRKASMFAPPLSRAASTRRWEKLDLGDELPSPGRDAAAAAAQAGDGDSDDDGGLSSEQEQLLQSQVSGAQAAAVTTGLPADRFMSNTAAAAAANQLHADDQATVEPKQEQQQDDEEKGKPEASAAVSATEQTEAAAVPPAAAAAVPPAASSGSRVGSRSRRKPTMTGASPVHTAVKDSVLTWVDEWSISRHEGLLNLGVVVLLATNIRMIMSNIFTYGLRLRLHHATFSDIVHAVTANRDNWMTLLALPACLVFAAVALMIEILGCSLLRREDKMLQGLVKKDTTPSDLRRHLFVMASRHEWLMFALNVLNVGASLLLPCWMVLTNNATLLPASALTFAAIITSMKLTTYAHCNAALRQHQRRQQLKAAAGKSSSQTPSGMVTPSTTQQGGLADGYDRSDASVTATAATAVGAAARAPGTAADPASFFIHSSTGAASHHSAVSQQQKLVAYPGNLNVGDLLYYMLAPTLSYQLNFPRLKKRRRRLLVKWCVMLVVTGLMMGFMQVQFLLPLMQSSLAPLREMNMLRFTERLLRLSIPSLVHWLAMFFLVFHLYLNVLGELLLFGDRVFYKEWWNAATLADYWKLWNMPVHKWMLRSVYFPLVRRGVGKFLALLIVFFISAVMHEVAVGVPLRMLKGWAFYGMFLQVPLISLTETVRKRLKSDTWGNIIFWASFCVLGQPMCLILYYHDWLLENMGMQGIAQAAAAGAGAAASAAAGSLAGGGAVCST